MGSKKQSRAEKRSINFWQMIRDVLVAALSKGQFPLALFGFILIFIIFKMPNEKVSELAFEIFYGVKSLNLIGIIISPIMLLGWFVHLRWQRKIFTMEIDRISQERNLYQKELLGKNINSSRS